MPNELSPEKLGRVTGGLSNGEQVKYTFHTYYDGDTLEAIAVEFKTTVEEICKLNNITPDTKLRPGDILILYNRF